jgi:hypothetical protein
MHAGCLNDCACVLHTRNSVSLGVMTVFGMFLAVASGQPEGVPPRSAAGKDGWPLPHSGCGVQTEHGREDGPHHQGTRLAHIFVCMYTRWCSPRRLLVKRTRLGAVLERHCKETEGALCSALLKEPCTLPHCAPRTSCTRT